MSYFDDALAATAGFEVPTPWMYRDSSAQGWVTCAIGEILPDVATAFSFPWQTPAGQKAAAADIAAEFHTVRAMPVGYPATFYRSPKSLLLPDAWMHDRLSYRMQSVVLGLRGIFGAAFDGIPDPAKVVLCDMGYNLGIGRSVPLPATGLRSYPQMIAAILAGDFERAAQECDRYANGKPLTTRNAWARNLLLSIKGSS